MTIFPKRFSVDCFQWITCILMMYIWWNEIWYHLYLWSLCICVCKPKTKQITVLLQITRWFLFCSHLPASWGIYSDALKEEPTNPKFLTHSSKKASTFFELLIEATLRKHCKLNTCKKLYANSINRTTVLPLSYMEPNWLHLFVPRTVGWDWKTITGKSDKRYVVSWRWGQSWRQTC